MGAWVSPACEARAEADVGDDPLCYACHDVLCAGQVPVIGERREPNRARICRASAHQNRHSRRNKRHNDYLEDLPVEAVRKRQPEDMQRKTPAGAQRDEARAA
eukprot:3347367-Alexandrium_andersonii.AAC.1